MANNIDMQQNNDITDSSSAMGGSTLNVIAGAWLILAPFLLAYSFNRGATEVDIITGAVVLLMGLVGVFGAKIMWSRWINVLAGAWLIFTPFIFSYGNITASWNDIIVGILAIAFAGFSLNSIGKQSLYGV